MLSAWGRFVHRRRWFVLLASVALLVVSIAVSQLGLVRADNPPLDAESGRGVDLLANELPRQSVAEFTLVFSSDSLTAQQPAFRDAMLAALAPLRADSRVDSVKTPYDAGVQPAGMISADAHDAVADVTVKGDFNAASTSYRELRAKVVSPALRVTGTGNLAVQEDFAQILNRDLHRAELLSIPLVLIPLMIVFGIGISALLPIGVGAFSVLAGLASAVLLSRATNVSEYAFNVVVLIGLGVAVDYSLFIVNRFREELRRGRSVEEATGRSLATAGRAITFSGLTVAAALAGMLFYRGTFLVSLGLAGSAVVAFAVLYALTLLPALLSLLGLRVERWVLPLGGRREGRGFWHWIAMRVMARPLFVLVPAVLLLILLGTPFAQIRLASADVSALPANLSEARRGQELLQAKFPRQEQNSIPVILYYPDGSPLRSDRLASTYAFSRRLAALPGVIRVDGIVTADPRLGATDYQKLYAQPQSTLPPLLQQLVHQTVGSHLVELVVQSGARPSTDGARELVRNIRALRNQAGDAQVIVTGRTAYDVDLIAFIVSHSALAVGFVVVVTYLVLFLLTGSVVLPLKAVITNFLSISASFGAMVWIFQQGHLSGFLNFTPAPIDPTLPPLVFCIVFGLSMDYEVLLLSRIQEEYLRTGDNRTGVAEGLERSGRLITGAAAIMVGVFLAFATADVVIIKSVGLAMAIAVAIDATFVRALIVPSVMRILGRANWWAPRRVASVYRRLRAFDRLAEAGAA